jgi:hypothetical protein
MTNWKKMVELARSRGLDPILHENHKLPFTRRELIAQGFLAGGGMLVGPSLLSTAAMAADAKSCGDPNADMKLFQNLPRYLCVELAGGWSYGKNAGVGGVGGYQDELDAGAKVQLAIDDLKAGEESSTDFGIPLRPSSGFYRGMKRGTLPELRPFLTGFNVCMTSNDDNATNQLFPGYWLVKAGIKGALSYLVGTEETAWGMRTMPAPDSMMALASTQIQSPGDARALLEATGIAAAMPGRLGAMLNASRGLSEAHMKVLNEKALPTALEQLVGCDYFKAAESAAKSQANDIDYRQDAELLTYLAQLGDATINPDSNPLAYTVNANFAQGNGIEATLLTMAYGMMKGYFGCGGITIGGYDYHQNDVGGTNQKDFNAGYLVGLYFTMAHYFANQYSLDNNFHVILVSDGSASGSAGKQDNSVQANGDPRPGGDQGEKGGAMCISYNRKKGIKYHSQKRQINYFTSAGAVNKQHDIGDNPALGIEFLLANAFNADGIDFGKVLPISQLPDADVVYEPKKG